MISPPLFECRNITFERDDEPLFADVGFRLNPSGAIQITGANGTGKTTLLRILAGSLEATGGLILWRGEDIRRHRGEFRAGLLYLGHSAAIKASLTPRENLRWYAGLLPQLSGRIDSALEAVNLAGYEDIPCHTLSAGQQRRVALARLQLASAPLWILDEPFTAIDVHGVTLLQGMMKAHLEQGGCLVITSHQSPGLENLELLDLESFAVVN